MPTSSLFLFYFIAVSFACQSFKDFNFQAVRGAIGVFVILLVFEKFHFYNTESVATSVFMLYLFHCWGYTFFFFPTRYGYAILCIALSCGQFKHCVTYY